MAVLNVSDLANLQSTVNSASNNDTIVVSGTHTLTPNGRLITAGAATGLTFDFTAAVLNCNFTGNTSDQAIGLDFRNFNNCTFNFGAVHETTTGNLTCYHTLIAVRAYEADITAGWAAPTLGTTTIRVDDLQGHRSMGVGVRGYTTCTITKFRARNPQATGTYAWPALSIAKCQTVSGTDIVCLEEHGAMEECWVIVCPGQPWVGSVSPVAGRCHECRGTDRGGSWGDGPYVANAGTGSSVTMSWRYNESEYAPPSGSYDLYTQDSTGAAITNVTGASLGSWDYNNRTVVLTKSSGTFANESFIWYAIETTRFLTSVSFTKCYIRGGEMAGLFVHRANLVSFTDCGGSDLGDYAAGAEWSKNITFTRCCTSNPRHPTNTVIGLGAMFHVTTVTATNCTFVDTSFALYPHGSRIGAVTLTGCKFYNINGPLVQSNGAVVGGVILTVNTSSPWIDGLTIQSSEFHDCGVYLLNYYGSPQYAYIKNVTINTGNVFYFNRTGTPPSEAIRLSHVHTVSISGNTLQGSNKPAVFTRTSTGGSYGTSTGVTVSGNTVNGSTESG